MIEIRKLLDHFSNYFFGYVLIMIASFISFPIYTRVLSTGDYGLLGLATSTVAFIVAISKLGLQHSIVRFYSDYKSSSNPDSISYYYSTFFISVILAGVVGSILLWVGIKFISNNSKLMNADIEKLLYLAMFLVIFHTIVQTFNQFFRAEQRPKANVLVNILSKYGNVAFGLVFFFCFYKDIHSLFLGIVLWQAIVSISLLKVFFKKDRIHIKNFSASLLKKSLKYGLPLIASEICHLFLQLGDRYLILYFLTTSELGIYTVGYDISSYIASLLIVSARDATVPIFMMIWVNKGKEETAAFLSKSFRYFMLIALPLLLGSIAVSPDLISLLASDKYDTAYRVVPFVTAGVIVYGSWVFFGAGLLVYKVTYIITVLMLSSCFINLILNVILIPQYGIIGAAVATMISYFLYILMLCITSMKKLPFQVAYRKIALYLVSSIVMYWIITNINFETLLTNVITKITGGVFLYFSLVILFDAEIRTVFIATFREKLWIKKQGSFPDEKN